MALSATSPEQYHTATATGTSDHIVLPPLVSGKDYVLGFQSDSTFTLAPEFSNDGGSNFDTVFDTNGAISVTAGAAQHIRVPAGAYRMNVSVLAGSYVTMRATES